MSLRKSYICIIVATLCICNSYAKETTCPLDALVARDTHRKTQVNAGYSIPFLVDLHEPDFYGDSKREIPTGKGMVFLGNAGFGYGVEFTYKTVPKYPTKNTLGYTSESYDSEDRFVFSRLRAREGNFSEVSELLFVHENYLISPENSVVKLEDTETLIKVNGYHDDLFMLWLLFSNSAELSNFLTTQSLPRQPSASLLPGNFGKAWEKGQWDVKLDSISPVVRKADFRSEKGLTIFKLITTGTLNTEDMAFPASSRVETSDSFAVFTFSKCNKVTQSAESALRTVTQRITAPRKRSAVIIDQSSNSN